MVPKCSRFDDALGPLITRENDSWAKGAQAWDMAGNVREWTSSPICAYPQSGPTMCAEVDLSETRGGAWRSGDDITVTYRYSDDPNADQSPDFGFRCVKNK